MHADLSSSIMLMLPRTSSPLSGGGSARISAAAGFAFGSNQSASFEPAPGIQVEPILVNHAHIRLCTAVSITCAVTIQIEVDKKLRVKV